MASKVVYLGRQPPAKDFIGKTLSALGGVLRSTGAAIDGIGASLQGRAGSAEQLTPNVAWMPVVNDGQTTSSASVSEVPARPSAAESAKINIASPVKEADVFVAPSANVMGHVKLGKGSSVWYGAVLRGEWRGGPRGSRTPPAWNVSCAPPAASCVPFASARRTPCPGAAASPAWPARPPPPALAPPPQAT